MVGLVVVSREEAGIRRVIFQKEVILGSFMLPHFFSAKHKIVMPVRVASVNFMPSLHHILSALSYKPSTYDGEDTSGFITAAVMRSYIGVQLLVCTLGSFWKQVSYLIFLDVWCLTKKSYTRKQPLRFPRVHSVWLLFIR